MKSPLLRKLPTLVIHRPGIWQTRDPVYPPRHAAGTVGVKYWRGGELRGCWTVWDGRLRTIPGCLLRLWGKSRQLPEFDDPPPV